MFVSSTYADLKNERGAVSQALMEMNCIPAGMELFPASNEEQFEFIKTVIDESDYYVLIIGGRYGSVDESGISYTEKEFDYALSKNMEVCAFVHSNPGKIAAEKTDRNQALEKKLGAFKERVASGRLVKFWDDPRDLPGKVVTSLNSAIRRKPAIGWVRGDRQAPPETLSEIVRLREENQRLKETLRSNTPPSNNDTKSELNKAIKLSYHEPAGILGTHLAAEGLGASSSSTQRNVTVTIAEILEKLGPDITDKAKTLNYSKLLPAKRYLTASGITSKAENRSISKESQNKVDLAITALGFAEMESGAMEKRFILTEKGKRALFEITAEL